MRAIETLLRPVRGLSQRVIKVTLSTSGAAAASADFAIIQTFTMEETMGEEDQYVEAKGSLAIVDKAVFRAAVNLLTSHNLTDSFDGFLEENGHFQILLDAQFANLLKKFLITHASEDPVAQMIIRSKCTGGPLRVSVRG